MAEPNPVGVSKIEIIQNEIAEIIALWQKNNPVPGWFASLKGAWFKAVSFLLKVVDYLILSVEDKIPDGPDKKATVLAAIGQIYDKIVPPLLPLFIKPFNYQIKSFVVDVLASLAIDFIVSKYREGSWRPKTTLANLI